MNRRLLNEENVSHDRLSDRCYEKSFFLCTHECKWSPERLAIAIPPLSVSLPHARQVKRLLRIRYKNAKYGLIIRGTLIKIELQHSGSNTMTFIISQRDRSCVLKFYSAQRSLFSFFFFLRKSIRIVRCTDAAMIRPVVRHFLFFCQIDELSEGSVRTPPRSVSSKRIQIVFSLSNQFCIFKLSSRK